jgi:tetratricopeptide (TPR) repeat protein
MSVTQLIEIEIPDLENPSLFAIWWAKNLEEKRPSGDLSKALENCHTPISYARAALVLGFDLNVRDQVTSLAGRAISLGSETVQLFGLTILATLEVSDSWSFTRDEFNIPKNARVLLQVLLEKCQKTSIRSALLTEIEARLYRELGQNALVSKDFENARRDLVMAIALGQGLKMNTFVYYARLLLAHVASESGQLPEARKQYQQLVSDIYTPTSVALDAQVFMALSLYWMGEDTKLIQLINSISTEFPRTSLVSAYSDALLVMVGSILELPKESTKALPTGTRIYAEVFQCIWLASIQRGRIRERKQNLLKAREAIEQFIFSEGPNGIMGSFLKAYILFQLKEYISAAKIMQNLLNKNTIPSLRIMILGLTLEISAIWNGVRLYPLHEITKMLSCELEKITESAQQDMVTRFSLLMPLAGAFFAVSPDGSIFESFLTLNILDLSERNIRVFGTLGLRPSHAVRYTLMAFGFEIHDTLDGGGQLNAEEKVLLRTVGSTQQWFSAISPAYLVYLLLQAHEQVVGAQNLKEYTSWNKAALQVVRCFGILPKTKRDSYQIETIRINSAIEKLFTGQLLIQDFRRLVEV